MLLRRLHVEPPSAPQMSAPARSPLGQSRRLLAYARPYSVHLVSAIVATLVSTALALVFPRVIGQLVDALFVDPLSRGDTAALDRAVVLLLLVALVQAVFNATQTYLLARVGEGVVADLRRALYAHLLGLPLRFFESRKTGEITSRLTSDVVRVQATLSSSLAQLLSQTLMLVAGVTILVLTSWKLTLVMLAVVPAVVLAATLLGRRMRTISFDLQERLADANAGATEAISGIRVVQSFVAENLERQRYATLIQAAFRVALRQARVQTLFGPGIMLAMFVGVAMVLWYGGRLVLGGDLTPGDLIAFVLYTFTVAASVGQFSSLYSHLQQALGATSRLFELLDEEPFDLPEPALPVPLPRPNGRVTLDGVWFHYPDRDQDVLRDVSLQVAAGEVVALVGPSGAGKSTLVSLMSRFYDPTRGRILLDDVDLRDLDLRTLRGHVGIVPQETHLFSGTIEENIRYGRPDASAEEIRRAAVDANAEEFILGFPTGYATLVGERGVKLSGGQRQRIAIARALLKNPRILILDEATSSLDSHAESLVQDALARLMRGRTTFVIAHRLSTVRGADRVVVVDHGQVVQTGTHAGLIDEPGLYRVLYESQFRAGVDQPAVR
jgi:ATP-binding cassette, subfamily B, bacterial MsbA